MMRPIQWCGKVNGMKVVLFMEFDNPKDGSRFKKYAEQTREPDPEWVKKLVEESNVKYSDWTDNTGHIISWFEFENMEAFSKMWYTEEWQKRIQLKLSPLVDNLRIRLLRPTVTISE
jgi:hypothetical protein